MTNEHPITPPPELRSGAHKHYHGSHRGVHCLENDFSVDQAAQWGADQELEACCEWLAYEGHEHEHLAAPRRPPPQAAELEGAGAGRVETQLKIRLAKMMEPIRRALEALDD
jgi:hypothetical protein